MVNKKSVVIAAVLLTITAVMTFAQSSRPLKTGRYAMNGSNLTMEIRSDSTVYVYFGRNNITSNRATGTYRFSEDRQRITFTFNRASGDLIGLQGMTWVYAIYDNETFFNNEENWMYIGRLN